jgi:4-hydroxy-tetrahydrodipicolinate reductase
MIKITIVGAAGRMGQALVRCTQAAEDMQLVGAIERVGHDALGQDTGALCGIDKTGVLLTSDLNEVLPATDAIIDFTLHDSVPSNAALASAEGKAIVVGTTGLTEEDTSSLKDSAEKVPIVWAPNMSLGVNLLFAAVRKAGEVLNAGYGVQIEETHHIHKKDAPSGTALRLGEQVADGRGIDFETSMIHDENGQMAEAPEGKIVIKSYREGEVVGDHTVSFENATEKIEFTHHAWNRDALAMGALHAARWVVQQKAGLYDMQDVLDL